MLKNNFASHFPDLEKTEKSSQSSPSKIPKSLCELGKTWKFGLSLTLKNPNFESKDELGKVRS